MSDEQINIAIAEHCGFTDIMWPTGFHQKMSDEKSKQAGGRWRFQIPDYCNDLNAMHEAEKTLAGPTIDKYVDNCMSEAEWWFANALTLSARRRAEAFLQTIGKWEEV